MEDKTMTTPGPDNQPTYWPPQQTPAPKKKHTARTVALIVAVGAVLAVCGIGGIAAIAAGGGSTKDKAITAPETTRDPTPAATTEAPVAEPVVTDNPTTKAPTAKPLSREQKNAIQEAKDYLDYQAFSRQGLIKQLSSEYGAGYPLKVATFAVDSLHINFNEQAAKAAKEYLDYTSFSRSGLIRQLESKYGAGFTHAQAVYGVNKAGL